MFNAGRVGKILIPLVLSSLRCSAEEVRLEAADVIAKFISCNHYSAMTREVLSELCSPLFFTSSSY